MDQEQTQSQNTNGRNAYNYDENRPRTLTNIESNVPEHVPYPKRVFCIISNEFCERFNYYGMRAVLILYLTSKLGYTRDEATARYHAFLMTNYFMCIFGGILSDVWLGKFKTIFYLSIVYACGSVIVASSSIPTLNLPPRIGLIVGLILIAVGCGGIKPCVSAFGADQFVLPQQAAHVATYFSMYYFAVNSGSLISIAITPIFRNDIHCFGDDQCFPLAFGVPAALMVFAIVIFLAGKRYYTYTKIASENMLLQVSKCAMNAISTCIRERRTKPRKNLLDYSIDKYGDELVQDTRTILRIILLYLPLPLFWAIFEQQGSRWTLQAQQLNGDLGFYVIKEDQMQLANALLVLVFLPLFNFIVYPILSKVGIRRPLQKMAIGGILAAVASFLSAMVQYRIDLYGEKTVSILWQIPQYIVITMGEVMFSPTGLEFSYEQAPESMKSVVQALWQMTVSIGQVIIIVIAGVKIFDSQTNEFLLFAVLMVIDMLIFMGISYGYESRSMTDAKPMQKQDDEFQDVSLKNLDGKA